MFRFTALAFAAALLVQDPSATQDRPDAGAVQTGPLDQTVNVPKGTRLDLVDCAGDVIVRTWDKDAVRVKAEPSSSRTQIKVALNGPVLAITASRTRLRDITDVALVDYEITVPAWLNLHFEGEACNVEATGVNGTIVVKTSEGDVVLKDVGGQVDAESLEGEVRIEGAKGKIRATSSDADITISRASGEIVAESIDGDVKVLDAQATSVELTTVDGDIIFSGPLQSSGKYRFESHDGDITLTIPENSNATLGLRTWGGGLQTTFQFKSTTDVRRGRRGLYTLGNGAAQLEISTFEGDIYIRKPGEKTK